MITIKVLSANLWLLPTPASLDNSKRLDDFIELALELDPEVINLQEVWLNQYVNRIKSRLHKYNLITPRSLLYHKSGLITLIKQKPIKTEFHKFDIKKDFKAVERILGKGFLRTQFAFKGNLVTVINTHIYQTENQEKLNLQLNQLKQIIKRAKKHNPTIIAGDLNMIPNTYSNLIKDFQTESILPKSYSETNSYAHKAVNVLMNNGGIYNSFPDRIIAHIKSQKAQVNITALTTPIVSDHYPLLAQISFPRGKYLKTSFSKSKIIINSPFRLARRLWPF